METLKHSKIIIKGDFESTTSACMAVLRFLDMNSRVEFCYVPMCIRLDVYPWIKFFLIFEIASVLNDILTRF